MMQSPVNYLKRASDLYPTPKHYMNAFLCVAAVPPCFSRMLLIVILILRGSHSLYNNYFMNANTSKEKFQT